MQPQNYSHSQFENAIEVAFGFLKEDFEFKSSVAEPDYVRYESKKTFISFYYATREAYDIEIFIGLKSKAYPHEDNGWPLQSILALHGVKLEPGVTSFQTTGSSNLIPFAMKLAELLKKYGSSALRGDEEEYERLRRDNHLTFVQQQIELLKAQADVFWQQRNFAKVMELYSSIPDGLSPAEVKRLDYARKHC